MVSHPRQTLGPAKKGISIVMKKLILGILTSILTVGCLTTQPLAPVVCPVINPTDYAKDCTILYNDELGRAPDPDGLVSCEVRLIARTPAPACLPVENQEQFRAWLRTSDEYKARQEALKGVVLQKFVNRNRYIGLEDGSHFTVIGASDFNLFGRFAVGEDITPILDDREGFNMLRVWLSYDVDGIGHYDGRTDTNAMDKLVKFQRFLAKKGKWSKLTLMTDAVRRGVAPADQIIWQQGVIGTIIGNNLTNATLEMGNEYGAGHDKDGRPTDGTNWFLGLPRPIGVFSSAGSVGGGGWPHFTQNGAVPTLPMWDWEEYHSNAQSEWWRKAGHEPMEMANANGQPACASENVRPDQDPTRAHHEDAAGSSALLSGCYFYHSNAGKTSTLFSPEEKLIANLIINAMRKVPTYCQDQPYIRVDGVPGMLRFYKKGNDPACSWGVRQ